MGFRRSSKVALQGSARSAASAWFAHLCVFLFRATLALAVMGVLGALVVLARLQQGPIALPGIAQLVVDRVNSGTEGVRIDVGNAVFSLGSGDAPSGLQFIDVSVADDAGQPVFHAPRIAAEFLARDVVLGRVQPIRITLMKPTVEVLRDGDGRFRVGLASGEPEPQTQKEDPGLATDRFEVIAEMLDSLVGDRSGFPQLSRLEEVRIIGADLTYTDERIDRSWQTQDASIRLSRHARGVRAVLTLDDIAGDDAGLSLRVLADRAVGTGKTLLTLQFGRVAAKALAGQAPGLEWMDLIDGEIEGRASAVLLRDGVLRDLSGVIVAENGALDLGGDRFHYDFSRIAFKIDPDGRSVEVQDFTATSQQVGVRMSAFADLEFDSQGAFAGLALDAELDRLSLAFPDVFDAPLAFDAAGVTARWDLASNTIRIASADLRAQGTTYVLSGELSPQGTDWLGDLRFSASDTTISEVLHLWPLAAAQNARDWVDQNIRRAAIPELLVNMRFGDGEPLLAMDFTFADLDATYLRNMSPLRAVAGTGHVNYHGLDLRIDDGFVQPSGQRQIALGGSRVSITGFWDDVTDTDISIAGTGRVGSVLALIDQEPLRLIRKLGVDLGPVSGTALLDVDLAFPLESDLLLEDVAVVANARLRDLGLTYEVPRLGPLRVEAEAATLRADTSTMSMAGDVRLDGVPSRIAWQENYGSDLSGRTLSLESVADPALLARLGLDGAEVSGTIPFSLDLTQNGSNPLNLSIDANLTPASVSVSDLGWKKPTDARGRLRVDLVPEPETVIERLRLETADLAIDGRIELDGQGALRLAEFARLDLRRTFDLAASVRRQDNSYSVDVDGDFLDLAAILDRQEESDEDPETGPPIEARFQLDRLRVSQDVDLRQAQGTVRRGPSGVLDVQLDANLAGRTPVSATLTRNASKVGKLSVTGADAGAVLNAMDLYDEAHGGKLTLNADLNADAELNGLIRIEDLQIGDGTSARQVLDGAGFEGAETVIESDGLTFRKIWIPFKTADGRIVLTDAIASSAALALKVNGSVDQDNGEVDLRGVISPAYGLTGALDNVPLLGTLLSGGEGEGILAMTFTLTGPSKDPDFSINPLSLLTPGFLRNIFEGQNSGSSEDFREQIQQPDR